MRVEEQVLTQALMRKNQQFMERLPQSIEAHGFSNRFDRKMHHLLVAQKKYGGHLWMERTANYATKAAVVAACLATINFVSVKAFGTNLWQEIVTNTTEFIEIHFQKPVKEQEQTDSSHPAVRMWIAEIPEGYVEEESYQEENMSVQYLVSEQGSILYTESLITETANVNIAQGAQQTEIVGNWSVRYIIDKDKVTAFFCDDMFYHIVEVEGADATQTFATEIIEKLEEQ